ncbi:hypothetical protein TorRG33x02_273040 [Trema orientale]|uniref:Transmembrane protein n=1 Tax=Trema orientale TaxID=63057 RepID=A0A2P5CUD1_TREOI|nr:hypothetical protein TorRG33x02_273040 [Trema orientale]
METIIEETTRRFDRLQIFMDDVVDERSRLDRLETIMTAVLTYAAMCWILTFYLAIIIIRALSNRAVQSSYQVMVAIFMSFLAVLFFVSGLWSLHEFGERLGEWMSERNKPRKNIDV